MILKVALLSRNRYGQPGRFKLSDAQDFLNIDDRINSDVSLTNKALENWNCVNFERN